MDGVENPGDVLILVFFKSSVVIVILENSVPGCSFDFASGEHPCVIWQSSG